MEKGSHIALPAACATTPRMEKIPAPIMPPMPIDTAAIMPIADPALTGGKFIAELMAGLADGFRGAVATAAFPTRNACGVTQPPQGTLVESAEHCLPGSELAQR